MTISLLKYFRRAPAKSNPKVRYAVTPTPGFEVVNFGITGAGQAYLEAIDGSKYVLSISNNFLGDPVLHLTLHKTDTY